MPGSPIEAYGAGAREGYGDVSTACSTTADGTPLLDDEEEPIVLMDIEDTYFLAKTPGLLEDQIYTDADEPEPNGFANGQILWLPTQTLVPTIGGRDAVTEGYYTLTAVDIGGGVNAFRVDETSLADTTPCPEVDPWTAESTPDEPQYSADFTINKYDNMSVQYKRQVEQIPFSKGSNTPANLRKRSSAYKVTKD